VSEREHPDRDGRPLRAEVDSEQTSVLPRLLDFSYPVIDRGEGVRLYGVDGREILDACSGGAMIACLGHGDEQIVRAAAEQAERVSYVYNHHFTNDAQERYADRLLGLAAPEMARVRLVTGGSEANETALRLVRSYHVERGDTRRWRIVSPAQSYHGATFGTLALSGRRGLQDPYGDYLSPHPHIRPSTWRLDPSGEAALAELDGILEEAGDEVAAFFCEPISAAALPAYSPPAHFWEGLAERRERHGFLVCFDEVVTGMGRTGGWFAYQGLALEPDIVTAGKAMSAGYAPLAGMLCREHVYEAIASGSRIFEHGHTWDGAPLSCAVGLAVLDALADRGLVERVAERGPRLRDELEAALASCEMVREVRGRGFLLGVEYVDPRDGCAFLPEELDAAGRIDRTALRRRLLVASTSSTADGHAGVQTLLAPAYTSSDEELAEIVERFAETVVEVERAVKQALAGSAAGTAR
jgi:adenosylmethionine-8-amino-7-oxononanoate aminotransferase